MKRNLFFLNLIIVFVFAFFQAVWAADYSSEMVSDPTQTSLIQNSKAEKKIISMKKHHKKEVEQKKTYDSSEVLIDSDYMDYYPERSEIEAIGNAKIVFKRENLTIYANKIVFNHDLNNIKAYENVKLINDNAVTDGDFINLDLNQDNGWIQKPVTKNFAIRVNAEEGYLYSDKIEEYKGVAKILKDYDVRFGTTCLSNLVNPGGLNLDLNHKQERESGVYNIKAKTIYIDSKDEHNIMTMENADIYMKKVKIGSLPSLKVVSNKEQQYVETNIPEFGSVSHLGMYAGPGIVLNVPGASTLKLIPMVNYDHNKWGIGGIARFRNENNVTEMAYGSANNELLLNGYQKFNDNLMLNYSQNTYQNEWFLGFRRPRYSSQIQYSDDHYIDDLGVDFQQRISVGYFVDEGKQITQADGRYRWMTQSQKTFYSYTNPNKDFDLELGAIAQTALTLYSTGDNTGIARVGPMIKTRYKNWTQDLIYYQSATAGKTPFVFDKYMYGKSNLVLVESLKLHKYLSVGYLGSLALLRDNLNDNILQENRFLLSLGPEHAKVTLGYDAYRQNTMMLFSMLVGTEGSDVQFDKAVITNPDTLSKKPEKHKLLHKIFPKLKKAE